MLPVRLRPEALEELTDAWRWYEKQREGLGDEFRACIDAAIAAVGRAPEMYPRVRGEVRRKSVRRFPYAVLYLVETGHVEVLAVFHCSRDPQAWKGRVQ
jgi:plasmid stabilization system protein ParE